LCGPTHAIRATESGIQVVDLIDTVEKPGRHLSKQGKGG
jgi:hypothetical protein